MKLISICPSNTELIHFLGLTNHLIAVDDFSDWPHEIQHLPRLGPDLSIDMDKVESMKPDLVLASLSVPGMEKNVDELKLRNIPHVVYNPQSLKNIQNDLLDLGERTKTIQQAEHTVHWMKNEMIQYKKISQTIKDRKKIYFEWWPKPVFTPGKTNWLTEIAELAGCTNVFQDVELASLQTTWEDVVSRKPEVIGMVWVGVKTSKMRPDHIQKRPGWDDLYNEMNTEIIKLEESLFCRPSPRLIFGLKRLAALVHPDQYPAFLPSDEDRWLTKTWQTTSPSRLL
ncbi:cobalamin-binding protein [Bacillus sp. NEB1478]|uniref:cobalamin-binding protein n=1 Tax=Bacillus sp. NEB1478 TaxID=3073816 RepID=UPI0028734A36|nr:cobalamin-binding protein [Bacillus sp. NEB1478]WNB92985.1 cobalamin-binding protein [Bacillus sp. NEB1478]